MSCNRFYISSYRVACQLFILLFGISDAYETCLRENDVELFVSVGANATGHPQVNVRLEQPLIGPEWHMNIKLSSDCANGVATRKIISLTLTGSDRLASPLPPPPPPSPTPTSPLSAPPPSGYSPLPGLGFFRVSSVALEWNEAREACEKEDAMLGFPASEREAALMARAVPRNTTGATHTHVAWVGASDGASEGRFVTVQGVPMENTGFSKWHQTEPNGGTSENCVGLTNQGTLIDASCKWKLAYICKIPLKLL